MRTLGLLAAFLFVCAASAAAQSFDDELFDSTEKAKGIAEQIISPAVRTSAEMRDLQRQKEEAVAEISRVADTRPENPTAQLAVGKSLASVEEAPRAIPYAERGLKLAETSGDKKMIREALLAGSEIYYKAGNYGLARDRAERILKTNPRDPDAMALYMQVKDRGTGPALGAGGAGRPPALSTTGTSAGSAMGSTGARESGRRASALGPGVAMTDAGSLDSQRQISLGWSRMKLDPAAALKHFDAAVAADKGAAARVERSKARLEAGDAAGALEDAEAAAALEPRLGAAFAARAEAKRSLGRLAVELLADYEAAAKLDGGFAEAYKAALVRSGAAASAGAAGERGAAGKEKPEDIPRGMLSRSPKGWGGLALIAAVLAAAGGLIVPPLLRRRRSETDGSLPR